MTAGVGYITRNSPCRYSRGVNTLVARTPLSHGVRDRVI